MAFSLDNHQARSMDDYRSAARLCAPLIQSALGLLPGTEGALQGLPNFVINVNLPLCREVTGAKGYYYTHQGLGCVIPAFREITEEPGPHLAEIDEHTPNLRIFRNYAGELRSDVTEGSDGWAVSNGWVSVTPLGLRSDICRHGHGSNVGGGAHMEAVQQIIKAAALLIKLDAAGLQ